jgi:hypothetical protein
MKIIFTSLALLSISLIAYSQGIYPLSGNKKLSNSNLTAVPKISKGSVPKLNTCDDDVYAFLNRTTDIGADYFWSTGTGIGQYFPYSGQGNMLGVQLLVASFNKYDGNAANGSSEANLNLRIVVYDTAFSNGPNLLGQQSFSFTDNADDYAWVPFDSPISVTGDYMVFLVNDDTRDIIPWMNANGDGQQEGLALIFDETVANPPGIYSYTLNVDDPATTGIIEGDRDAMILPYIDHNIIANFTASTLTVNTGATVNFSNTSVIDSVGYHNAYQYATTPATDLFVWDFNDGSTSTSKNASHAFTTCGVYNVSLTANYVNAFDSLVCFDTKTLTITVQDLIQSTSSTTQSACGQSTGSVSLTNPTGGTPAYTYLWNNNVTTQNLTNVGAGVYSVTITDANQCSVTLSNIVVSNPGSPTATVTPVNVTCNGGSNGSASATVTGGTSPYTYAWSNNSSTTTNASGLSAGNYTMTVLDANQCITAIPFTITQPTALVATATVTNVLCFGGNSGSASVTVTGGTSPYTYAWSNNSSTTSNASGLSAGNYTMTVLDVNQCLTAIPFTITQPAALVATATVTNVLCFGGNSGSAAVQVTGGTSSYSYTWNTNPAQTGSVAQNLIQGSYTVTVVDANACTTTAQVTVSQPQAALSVSTAVSPGAVNATITGGTSPYTYSWSNNATTEDISGVAVGSYTLTVTDANGCTSTSTAQVTTVSIDELNNEFLISLFPNPTSSEVTIQTSENNLKTTTFVVISEDGKIVLAPSIINSIETTIDVSKFASGVYYVQFISEKNVLVKKLVVRK